MSCIVYGVEINIIVVLYLNQSSILQALFASSVFIYRSVLYHLLQTMSSILKNDIYLRMQLLSSAEDKNGLSFHPISVRIGTSPERTRIS